MASPYADWAPLAQEPWCYTPDRLRRTTRRQCRALYLEPAAERAKSLAADGPSPAADAPARWDWDAGLPPRDVFVAQVAAQQGVTHEAAGAMWDRMHAAERQNRGGVTWPVATAAARASAP
jgi:hypothetical protein